MSDQALTPETVAVETAASEAEADTASARDVVAGLLAGASVVLSAIGAGGGLLLEIGGHPGKLIPIAALLAIVAGVMSKRFQSMALKALIFASIAWVVGMTIAVITDAPLF